MPNVNVPLSQDLHRRLKIKVSEEGTTVKEFVADAIEKRVKPK